MITIKYVVFTWSRITFVRKIKANNVSPAVNRCSTVKKGKKLVHRSKTSKLVISVKCIHRKVFLKLVPTAWGTSLLQSDSDRDWKWYITTMFAVCIKSPPSGIFHSEPLLSWINRHITVSPECSPHCWLATGTRSVFKGKNKFICWLFFLPLMVYI